MALPSLWHVRGRPGNALDNAGLPRCTHPDNNSASRLFSFSQVRTWTLFSNTKPSFTGFAIYRTPPALVRATDVLRLSHDQRCLKEPRGGGGGGLVLPKERAPTVRKKTRNIAFS